MSYRKKNNMILLFLCSLAGSGKIHGKEPELVSVCVPFLIPGNVIRKNRLWPGNYEQSFQRLFISRKHHVEQQIIVSAA